jgi:hypothetical protein
MFNIHIHINIYIYISARAPIYNITCHRLRVTMITRVCRTLNDLFFFFLNNEKKNVYVIFIFSREMLVKNHLIYRKYTSASRAARASRHRACVFSSTRRRRFKPISEFVS